MRTFRKGPACFYVLSLLLCCFFVLPLSAVTGENDGKVRAHGSSQSDDGMKGLIVELEDPPLASYKGGIEGLNATSIEVTGDARLDLNSGTSRAYLSYIEGKQKLFERKLTAVNPSARIIHRYSTTMNGISLRAPESMIDQLSLMEEVKAVYPDKLQQPDTTASPTLIGANKLWGTLGGKKKAGEGIIVGIIDTGIWPEHLSFSDPDPSGKSYPAPRSTWKGKCDAPLDSSTPITCTNKLIGARFFLAAYKAENGGLPAGDFDSARDSDGHGTHVSSTAAGNSDVEAVIAGSKLGKISGIAPRAHVAMYRVCSVVGCYDSDSIAAIDKAVEDGVDVINYSISAGVDPYADPVQLAFLNAYKAGVFVASSAGNTGPYADTVGKRGGWMVSVAASSNSREFVSTINVTGKGGRLKLTGLTVTGGVKKAVAVVLAANYGDELCLNPFTSGTFSGQIVACKRGNNARVQKGYNVLQGGAGGMILYNAQGGASDVVADVHYLPAVHIDAASGVALPSFLGDHPEAKGTFTQGTKKNAQKDVVASFSSRGGTGQAYGINKPDVTAPGVTILAGTTSDPIDTTVQKPGELFTLLEGTSMASPHVAGAGALLKDLNPTWTPGQIKSALMTTALTTGVVKEDGTTAAGPFDCGSGRIDLGKAGKPGITFDVSGDDFVTYKSSLWLVNYPSVYIPYFQAELTITRVARSLLPKSSTWRLSTTVPPDLVITVPSSLIISGNGDTPFPITINGDAIPSGGVRHGTIFMKSGSYQLHIPVTVVKRPSP